MTSDELQLLKRLDQLVFQAAALREIESLAAELASRLETKPAAPFVRQELPLTLFGAALPPEILSSNIYVIRPAVSSGLERHPNSHQRSMSLSGTGAFILGSDALRQRHALDVSRQSDLAGRWVSIPPQTWHEALAGDAPWTVITFHTAPDREIINERM